MAEDKNKQGQKPTEGKSSNLSRGEQTKEIRGNSKPTEMGLKPPTPLDKPKKK